MSSYLILPFYNTPNIPKFYFFPFLFKYSILFFFYYFSLSILFSLFLPQPLAMVSTHKATHTDLCVRTYVFHLLGTYVTTLCNWLILCQNTLYLYLGRFRTCLNTSRNHASRSSVKAFKFVQENKLIVQIHQSSTAGLTTASIELKKAVQSPVCSTAA